MHRWLTLLLAFAAATLAATPAHARRAVHVAIARTAANQWTVDYAFDGRPGVWFFPRSNPDLDGKPWRPQAWTVETPGVALVRAGHYDVLAATGGKPLRQVRIRMRAFAQPLIADYTPALAFSDGGVALYGDHFTVARAASLEAVAAYPADLIGTRIEQAAVTLDFADPGRRLLLRGKALTGAARLRPDRAAAYLYAGDAPVIDTPAFAGVIDAGLPQWVRTELDDFAPRLMALYARRLGPPAGSKPMALVAWQGADQPGWSFGGSVLQGMVVMQISGQRVLKSDPEVLSQARWFIGHESAHFWLGQTVNYTRRSDAWIMEGGADLLAMRAFAELDPNYSPRARLQAELDECIALTGPGEPLAQAEERGEARANYACGAMLMLAAESAAKTDIFAFVRALIDTHRKRGTLTSADWLAGFQIVARNPAIADEVRGFLEAGVADPRGFWMRVFGATGVGFSTEGDHILLS